MTYKSIPFEELELKVHHYWHRATPLLTSGDFAAGDFNTMVVGWGSLGTIWAKPFAQVLVRPSRYTYQFMEKYDNFTLSMLPETYKRALGILGTKSGRDGDKIKEAGVTPIASSVVSSPAFAEAELIIECRKIYWQDMAPEQILDAGVLPRSYHNQDFHRIYFGEMVAILAR